MLRSLLQYAHVYFHFLLIVLDGLFSRKNDLFHHRHHLYDVRRRLLRSHRDFRHDHDRLYGDTAAAVVPPYESVHRGLDGLVFDEQTLEVRAAYRGLSLQAPRLNREPDDHIGLEFDFVARSCLRAIDALDAGDEAEAERFIGIGAAFVRDHLLPWAPEMLATAIGRAHTHFMRGVGLLSLGALASYVELVDAS